MSKGGLLPRVIRRASSDWINDNAPRLGASVTFYTLLSLAPVIVIAVAVAALVYGQEAAHGRLASEIRGLAGPELARTIQEVIRDAYMPGTGVIATLLGLATLAFGASSVFVELHDALNTIWAVSLPRDKSNAATIIRLVRDRFYSFMAVVGVGFLLLIALILEAGVKAMRIPVSGVAVFLMTYLLVAALFAALYKIVPDVRLKWSDVVPGAMITGLLFAVGKQLWDFTSHRPELDRRIVLQALRSSSCCGCITRHSYSFGALNSAKLTRRPWGPTGNGEMDARAFNKARAARP